MASTPARKTASKTPATAKPTKPAKKVVKNVVKKEAAAQPQTPRAATKAVPVQPVAKPKHKLVRDSFTIPKTEYAVLEGLKLRAANLKRPTKKSELLRAGVAALHAMTDKAFLAAVAGVPSLKTGRPKQAAGAGSKPGK